MSIPEHVFHIGDRVRVRTEVLEMEGIACTPAAIAFTQAAPGEKGIVHEIDEDGRIWVRLRKPLAEPGALWPLRADQLEPLPASDRAPPSPGPSP